MHLIGNLKNKIMSDYESHTGKLRKVEPKENETFEQLCKRLWIEESQKGDEYTEEDYKEGSLFGDYYEKYINDNDESVLEIFDHEKEDDSDGTVCKIFKNTDGTYSFYTHFYNGGTDLSEMIQDGLKKK